MNRLTIRRYALIASVIALSLSTAWVALCRANSGFFECVYGALIPMFTRISVFMGDIPYAFAESVAVLLVAAFGVGFLASILLCLRKKRVAPFVGFTRVSLCFFAVIYAFYAFTWAPLYARAYAAPRHHLTQDQLILALSARAEDAFNRLKRGDTDRDSAIISVQKSYAEHMQLAAPKTKLMRAPNAFYRFGITGHYSPFTFEALVNPREYDRLFAFTAAHEMAHALGYAREDDANLIAYSVCTSSPDPALNYAATLAALNYAAQEAYLTSAASYAHALSVIPALVRPDFDAIHCPPNDTTSLFGGVQTAFLTLNGQSGGASAYRQFLAYLPT